MTEHEGRRDLWWDSQGGLARYEGVVGGGQVQQCGPTSISFDTMGKGWNWTLTAVGTLWNIFHLPSTRSVAKVWDSCLDRKQQLLPMQYPPPLCSTWYFQRHTCGLPQLAIYCYPKRGVLVVFIEYMEMLKWFALVGCWNCYAWALCF